MSGDGFAAGDGCRYDDATSGECTVLVLRFQLLYIALVMVNCARVIACAAEVLSSRPVLVGGGAGPGVTLTCQPGLLRSIIRDAT